MFEGSFTVTFDPPFYVGIFERFDERGYSVAKIIFGAEPSDETVRLTVMRHYRSLQFSQPVPERPPKTDAGGYKRRQRELKHMLEQEQAASDEFHQALAAERERARMEREKAARAAREAEEQRKFQLRQERHKEKKKGH